MSDLYRTLLISRPQVVSSGGSGLLTQANNLSDVADVATARTNLGVSSTATLAANDSNRKKEGFLYSDGATSNRGQVQTPGTRGNLAGAAQASWVGWVDVPTSNPSALIFITNVTATTTVGASNNSTSIYINTSGNLVFDARGASSGNDIRTQAINGFITSYGGQRVWLDARLTTGTSTPVAFVNGAAQTFAAVFTQGSVPNWLDANLSTTFFLTGANWPAGIAPLGSWLNAHLTNTESDTWRTTGRPPVWVTFGGTCVAQTSGTLTIGRRYRIGTYVAGDSFTNVGASSNATGVEFTATGTTPTTWTNSSSLLNIGALSLPSVQAINVVEDITSIGGNQARLVGNTPILLDSVPVSTVERPAEAYTTTSIQLLGGAISGARKRRILSVTGNSSASVNLSLGTSTGGTQLIATQAVNGDFDISTFASRILAAGSSLWLTFSGSTTASIHIHLTDL